MAYLTTFEGETNRDIDRLFNCNDVLGVTVYGLDNWNKLKKYASSMAKNELARGSCLGREKNFYYVPKNDILDRAYGFRHELGAALLGAERWGGLVQKCKAAGTLGGFTDLFTPRKIVEWSKDQLLPEFTPTGLLKFATGIQQIKGVAKTAEDITGYTDYKTAQAAKAAAEAEQKQQQELYRQFQEKLALQEQEQKNLLEIEKAKAEAEATATIKSSPAYQAESSNKLLILGALGLAAVALLSSKK